MAESGRLVPYGNTSHLNRSVVDDVKLRPNPAGDTNLEAQAIHRKVILCGTHSCKSPLKSQLLKLTTLQQAQLRAAKLEIEEAWVSQLPNTYGRYCIISCDDRLRKPRLQESRLA